jgi:hypothetical protein
MMTEPLLRTADQLAVERCVHTTPEATARGDRIRSAYGYGRTFDAIGALCGDVEYQGDGGLPDPRAALSAAAVAALLAAGPTDEAYRRADAGRCRGVVGLRLLSLGDCGGNERGMIAFTHRDFAPIESIGHRSGWLLRCPAF